MKTAIIAAIVLHLVGLTVCILNKTMDGWVANEFFTAVGVGVILVTRRNSK